MSNNHAAKFTIAVIGSRTWRNHRLLWEMLDKAIKNYEAVYGEGNVCLVSGGAEGADKIAESYAETRGIPIEVIRPDFAAHGQGATFRRNREIVHRAGVVFAFWDGRSKGTEYTMNMAIKEGKKIWAIYDDGSHLKL